MKAIEKSINRHQWKEVKRLTVAFKRENQQAAALIDEIDKYLSHCKAMEWHDNLVTGYDFQVNQSTVKDMTSEEKKEWADKFFSAL